MGDAFRRLFLGLGVALGLASGQPDPTLVAGVSASAGDLVLYARVEEAFAAGALELVESGTRVALRYSVQVDGANGAALEASQVRAVWYDLRTGLYFVSVDGERKGGLVDPQAARTLVAELRDLRLCAAAEAAPEGRAVIGAEIGILDGRGEWHHAPVLWNYRSPKAVVALAAAARTGGAAEAGK
jgi:hypothetical protein